MRSPHLVYRVTAKEGTATASFSLRLEKGATVYHEWRDWSSEPYIAGPSLTIDPQGSLTANGQQVMTLPTGQWVRFEIQCPLGTRAAGAYQLTVTLPNQPPPSLPGRLLQQAVPAPHLARLLQHGQGTHGVLSG